jgi:hypothetical protein
MWLFGDGIAGIALGPARRATDTVLGWHLGTVDGHPGHTL